MFNKLLKTRAEIITPYVGKQCILKKAMYFYKDETRDIRSNITLGLKEFPRELMKAKGYI